MGVAQGKGAWPEPTETPDSGAVGLVQGQGAGPGWLPGPALTPLSMVCVWHSVPSAAGMLLVMHRLLLLRHHSSLQTSCGPRRLLRLVPRPPPSGSPPAGGGDPLAAALRWGPSAPPLGLQEPSGVFLWGMA